MCERKAIPMTMTLFVLIAFIVAPFLAVGQDKRGKPTPPPPTPGALVFLEATQTSFGGLLKNMEADGEDSYKVTKFDVEDPRWSPDDS